MVTDNVDLDIEGIAGDGERAIAGAHSTEVLAQVETEYLGKRSALTRAHRTLGGLSPEERKEAGRRLNEVRTGLESQLAERRAVLAEAERGEALRADRLDLTEVIPAQVLSALSRGHLHLVTQARAELEDVFVGMGFARRRGARGGVRLVQLRGVEHPAGPPGPRHVRHACTSTWASPRRCCCAPTPPRSRST